MNLLTINNMTKAFTDKILFDQVDFSINEKEKIGVIGINGTGKSTLLKMIAGIETPNTGEISKGNNVHIRYLPQSPVFKPDISIYDYVIKENMTEENMTEENKWMLEGEAKKILNKLGFSDYEIKVDHLSGGEKKRIALAGALLSTCDILVLDEPTNHIDSSMTKWLEDYLIGWKASLIMVTHDRYFLDRVSNRIIEIDKGKIYSYPGNYSKYLELKMLREDIIQATERKRQSLLRTEYEWMQRGARARSTKQKAHIERFEKLRDEQSPTKESTVEMNSVSSRMGNKTIELNAVTKSYGITTLIKDFTYIFLKNDRIGIIGPNGCGKSTLLKIINKIIEPDSGSVEWGSTIKISYFSQENEDLDESQRVIDYMKEVAEYIETPEGKISVTKMLENFLFDSTLQYSLISKLSGGEKRRLYLLKILANSPNVLILDEPTNDLDIQTLGILETYLDTFMGIVICVSHDRFFLDRVALRLFAFEGNGNIRQFEGTYTEYIANIDWEAGLKKDRDLDNTTDNVANPKTIKPRERKLKLSYQEEKEYKVIDEDIANLEDTIRKLNEDIEKHSTDFIKLSELTEEKSKTEAALEEKMDRWMYLNELVDKINNQQ